MFEVFGAERMVYGGVEVEWNLEPKRRLVLAMCCGCVTALQARKAEGIVLFLFALEPLQPLDWGSRGVWRGAMVQARLTLTNQPLAPAKK